ncbi:hypothetical protein AVEN_88819-1 [Araneus ventricosus]|uniref:Uncharacterized protein n=1 Tax=Araneus ventricosus TaxID=182803 RepID=A0A4Y2PT15_ARAVE|nr:hypothetical protein AVEN_88819-1 [Araneus ventricosus]
MHYSDPSPFNNEITSVQRHLMKWKQTPNRGKKFCRKQRAFPSHYICRQQKHHSFFSSQISVLFCSSKLFDTVRADGVNAFSQNEIEHFECCDDDVITSEEVSEEDIVALVNETNNSTVDSSSDMEEEQDELGHSIADAKAAANVLNNFFATENNDEHVVDLFKIVDKKFDELYIKSKTFQPKITFF